MGAGHSVNRNTDGRIGTLHSQNGNDILAVIHQRRLRVEAKQNVIDWSLIRQAATAMSAGIMLALIGSPPRIAIIGFGFSVLSIVFLVAAVCQLWRKT